MSDIGVNSKADVSIGMLVIRANGKVEDPNPTNPLRRLLWRLNNWSK